MPQSGLVEVRPFVPECNVEVTQCSFFMSYSRACGAVPNPRRWTICDFVGTQVQWPRPHSGVPTDMPPNLIRCPRAILRCHEGMPAIPEIDPQ